MPAPIYIRRLACLLAGGTLEASRIVPFPHHFTLRSTWVTEELEEESVRALVDQRFVTPKPLDELWDRIAYRLTAAGEAEALRADAWPHGFGACPSCHSLVALTKTAKLARHGFQRQPDGSQTAACDGSGKVPARAFTRGESTSTPTPEVASVAA